MAEPIEFQHVVKPRFDIDGRCYGWFLNVTGRQGDLRQMVTVKLSPPNANWHTDDPPARELAECKRNLTEWFRDHGDEARAHWAAQNLQ